MIGSDPTSAALVDWINSFPISPKIVSLSELSDGNILAQVLIDIDPYYFRSTGQGQDSSPEGHWVLRFHKLKRIHKDLTRYYTDTLGHRLPPTPPNLTLIAKDAARDETIKLVKIIVAAAVQSERREEYINRIQSLSRKSQTELMLVINQMIQLDEADDLESGNDKSMAGEFDDNAFRMEEEMARLAAEKEAVEIEKKQLARRFDMLQHDYEESQNMLDRLRDQVGNGMSSDGYGRADALLRSQFDQLQSDVQRLEDIIVDKESIISEQGATIGALTRKVDDLSPKAEAAVKWKDDLDEAHHLIEKLRKGQNVAEKYRRKLEGMSDMERQVRILETQNAQLQQNLRHSEESSKQSHGLRKLVDTYKKQVEKLEVETAELLRSKQRMEVEFNAMRDKIAGAEMQKSRDTEQIQSLEEKVRELETGVISKAVEEVSGDLESELSYSTKTKADLKLQISRLEAEVYRLKEGGATSADNMILKSLLDDATKAKDKLEHNYLEAHTERLILEAQLAALRGGGTIDEGSEVFLRMRQTLADREHELSDTKKLLAEVEAELKNTMRELANVKTDLSLVGMDRLEALEELKALTAAELIELRKEHEDLQGKLKDAQAEADQGKGLLNTLLLEKDELAKKHTENLELLLEKERGIAELRATCAALEGSSEGRDAALEKRVVQLQNKLEDHREKMTKSREYIKKQNGIVKELREKLEAAESAAGVGLPATAEEEKEREEAAVEKKRKKQETLELVQRENRLITSAWYDVASRLQMNSVVLVRKSDPTSWLGKQRVAIHSPIKK